MKKDIQKLVKILLFLSEGKSQEEKGKVIKNFVKILKEKRKTYLLPKILKEVEKEKKKKEVVLVLSRKQDEKIVAKIEEFLKKNLGREKEIKIRIDENLISGFLARSEDYLISASIKGMLQNLKSQN